LTKLLQNTSKYISQGILEKCFEFGKHNFVDKVICGNGFSTAFLKSPVKVGKKSIIIVPNLAVIHSKKLAYNNGEIDSSNTITFHHQDSTDTISKGGDIMMFVADSFIVQLKKLIDMAEIGAIDKILIDEAHTIEQGSSYRRKLRDFNSKIEPFKPFTSVVSVTATPNMANQVDIRIVNALIKPIIIHYTNNKVKSLNRLKQSIKNGLKVYIATNDWNIIYHLRNSRTREVEANFMIGESMFRSLADKIKIIHNPESNLVIGSSRSFEGMDLLGKDWLVYFFESRDRDFETFYISNLYQAFNRPRQGTKYIEYCRTVSRNERQKKINEVSVDKFINDRSKSTEKKMKTENKDYYPFVIFECNNQTGFWNIKKDKTAINLLTEAREYDKGFESFKDFLKQRKVTVKALNEAPVQIGYPKIKEKIKIINLYSNRELITEKDLFGDDYKLSYKYCNKPIDFYKTLENYFRNKNYDGEYKQTEMEKTGVKLISDNEQIKKLVKSAISRYNEKHKNNSNKNGERDKRRELFKKHIENKIRRLVMLLMNNRIKEHYTISGNRQYSNIVQCSSFLIEEVCQLMGITFTQVDIKTCNCRIIYALNGLELPDNFYGEDKKNKKVINTYLNNFFYNPDKKSSKEQQKYDAKRRLSELGFHEKVINWLIKNYFDPNYRSDLFNLMTWHEKQIIFQVKDSLFSELNKGSIRKHDELMLFDNTQDLTHLNHYKYLGLNGWFEIDTEFNNDWFLNDIKDNEYNYM
jgi:hypothetical protein